MLVVATISKSFSIKGDQMSQQMNEDSVGGIFLRMVFHAFERMGPDWGGRIEAVLMALVLTAATSVHAVPIVGGNADNWVYGDADTTGGNYFSMIYDTQALSFSVTGSQAHGTGTATASASLSDGFLKAYVSGDTGACCTGGQASLRLGLGTKINLVGPSDVGGVVAVTMHLAGDYGISGAVGGGMVTVDIETGPGRNVPGPGFASGDASVRGDFAFRIIDSPQILGCDNCSYDPSSIFPISVTAYLPFNAGDDFVRYSADLTFDARGRALNSSAFVDASHTALFSIDVPDGFSYSSALSFVSPTSSVPIPGTITLVVLGLAMCGIGRRLGKGAQSIR